MGNAAFGAIPSFRERDRQKNHSFFFRNSVISERAPPEPRVFGEELRESEWDTLSYRKPRGMSRRTGGVFPEARSSKGVGWMVL